MPMTFPGRVTFLKPDPESRDRMVVLIESGEEAVGRRWGGSGEEVGRRGNRCWDQTRQRSHSKETSYCYTAILLDRKKVLTLLNKMITRNRIFKSKLYNNPSSTKPYLFIICSLALITPCELLAIRVNRNCVRCECVIAYISFGGITAPVITCY